MTGRRARLRHKEGQAITELIVALVALLVLVGGIIVLGRLSRAQTQAMREARRSAGIAAMSDASPFSGPQYIESRDAGADRATYSRDDGVTQGDPAAFQAGVVRYAHPDAVGTQVNGNPVTTLYGAAFPALMFGFTHGEHEVTVTNMPIIRDTVYRDDRIQVHGDAWLTWTKGIY